MATTKITPAPLTRTLAEIGREIRADYRAKGKPVYYAAAPYLDAMRSLQDFGSRFYEDTAEDVVIRLLGNLSTWRGETATRVKGELRAALAHHQQQRGATANARGRGH